MSAPSATKFVGDDPIYEADVVDKYPLLSVSTLRSARKARQISWIKGKQGRAYYRPSAIEDFIANHLEMSCHAPEKTLSLNSANSGSQKSPPRLSIIDSGLNPELAEHAAQALARKI